MPTSWLLRRAASSRPRCQGGRRGAGAAPRGPRDEPAVRRPPAGSGEGEEVLCEGFWDGVVLWRGGKGVMEFESRAEGGAVLATVFFFSLLLSPPCRRLPCAACVLLVAVAAAAAAAFAVAVAAFFAGKARVEDVEGRVVDDPVPRVAAVARKSATER